MTRLTFILFAAAFVLPPAYGQESSQTKAKTDPAASYKLVELPLRPLAISENGWIAGTTADHTAARWNSRSGLEHIPLPPEFILSEGTGINSKGDTVGVAYTADSSRSVAFIFRLGKTSLLPGEQSRAEGINDAGEISGQSKPPGEKTVGPVHWTNNSLLTSKSAGPKILYPKVQDPKVQDLKLLDLKICCAGVAKRINGNGQIIGDTYDRQGHYHAFLWDAEHESRLLATPDEEYSSALALNQRGEVVVQRVPGGLFLYSDGRFESIDAPQAAPLALNKNDEIVGSFGPQPEGRRAFIWDKALGLRDLNTLIGVNPDWKLEAATGINDRGEIVGWGDHGDTENAGFLLLPLGKR